MFVISFRLTPFQKTRINELGPDAAILAVNSVFTKRGRTGVFHDGSPSKEVFTSAVPSCQNDAHQGNAAGNAEIVCS